MTDQFPFESGDEAEQPDQRRPEGFELDRVDDDPLDEGYAPADPWSTARDYDNDPAERTEPLSFEERLEQEEPEVEDDWEEEAVPAGRRRVGAKRPSSPGGNVSRGDAASGAAESPEASPLADILYPPLEPYVHGRLDVGDGQQVYWEECGNPEGKPVVFLHGGPGGGCSPAVRRLFDPSLYRIVLFDQRGCGRSLPHASEPSADLDVNTTWHLVADVERIRQDRKVDRWQVFGGSWGSALALAYAEEHPERVTELVLRGIFTLRRSELDWYYNGGAGALFPDRYEEFLAPLGGRSFRGDAIAAYAELLSDPDPAVHQRAGLAWSSWEAATITLTDNAALADKVRDPAFALAFARIENHYFVHAGWLADGQLLARADRLAEIPGVIIQGRYDLATPAVTAWELHRAWPAAELTIVPAVGHSDAEPPIARALVAATDRLAREPGHPTPRDSIGLPGGGR